MDRWKQQQKKWYFLLRGVTSSIQFVTFDSHRTFFLDKKWRFLGFLKKADSEDYKVFNLLVPGVH